MRVLTLLRHGLTEANARRLYCGWTDLPLSPAGRETARRTAQARPLGPFDFAVTSGLRRADETLALLTGLRPDIVLEDLREMHFGAFEMRGHDELTAKADYRRWIDDANGAGDVRCPGGESRNGFRARVLRGGERLLALEWKNAIVVSHGGAIAALMAHWFPDEPRGFYDWQPEACRGWRVGFDGVAPVIFEEV